jgi:hypothetical protein
MDITSLACPYLHWYPHTYLLGKTSIELQLDWKVIVSNQGRWCSGPEESAASHLPCNVNPRCGRAADVNEEEVEGPGHDTSEGFDRRNASLWKRKRKHWSS